MATVTIYRVHSIDATRSRNWPHRPRGQFIEIPGVWGLSGHAGETGSASVSQGCLDILVVLLTSYRVQGFFNLIHHSISIFRRDRFVEQYRNRILNHCVLATVLVATAKLLDLAETAQIPEIESCLQVLLKDDPFEGFSQSNLIQDGFRRSCLFAYSRFHQFHG